MEKQIKAFETLMRDENFVQEMENDVMLKVTFNALYNYVKKGNNLLDLPWFNLLKTNNKIKLAA